MNTKPAVVLCKREIYSALLSPAIPVTFVLFFLATAVPFFFFRPFFTDGSAAADLRVFFALFPWILSCVVPVLTMNVFPEDDSFFALPFTVFQTVFAKWLASFCILLVFLTLTIVVPLLTSLWTEVDFLQTSVTYATLVFYCACAAAVGVFFSALVQINVLSSLLTGLSLFASAALHLLPLYVSVPPALAAVCNFLSSAWHLDASFKGIVDTRDFIFFGVFSAFFLFLAARVVRKRRKR